MDSSRFDELTKALATPTSRRQALRRIGGTLAGSLLAAWPFTQALAAGGGNSACAHFCATIFGADTPAAEQCTSDAAHGKGLCSTCGSNADPSSVCCTRNASGYCTSYSGASCCGSSATCLDGSCCPSGNVCNTALGTLCCATGTTCQAHPGGNLCCVTCGTVACCNYTGNNAYCTGPSGCTVSGF